MGEQKETISYKTARGELIKTLTPIGEVESDNYKGRDRRTNGARLKLATRDWIAIGSLLITLILFGGNIKWTTEANSKTIGEQNAQIRINTTRLDKTEVDIINIKDNLLYIRGKLDTLVLRLK